MSRPVPASSLGNFSSWHTDLLARGIVGDGLSEGPSLWTLVSAPHGAHPGAFQEAAPPQPVPIIFEPQLCVRPHNPEWLRHCMAALVPSDQVQWADSSAAVEVTRAEGESVPGQCGGASEEGFTEEAAFELGFVG